MLTRVELVVVKGAAEAACVRVREGKEVLA